MVSQPLSIRGKVRESHLQSTIAPFRPCDHLNSIRETQEERSAAIFVHLLTRLERVEQCRCIFSQNTAEIALKAMGQSGINPDRATQSGVLRIATVQEKRNDAAAAD